MPWKLHRIAVSPHYRASLHEIQEQWTLMDVLDANDVIEALDNARSED